MLKKPPVLSHINIFLARWLRSLLAHSSHSHTHILKKKKKNYKNAGYADLKSAEVYS